LKFEASLGNSSQDPISKKPSQKKRDGMVEWLKVQGMSSKPGTAKKKKKLSPRRIRGRSERWA
jgi:hypothetical protein